MGRAGIRLSLPGSRAERRENGRAGSTMGERGDREVSETGG